MVFLKRTLLAVIALFILASVALADSTVPYLGKQATAVSANAPLAGFKRVAPFLRSSGKPAIFLIGASVGPYGASQSWSLIKALGQFGTWSRVQQESAPSGFGFNETGVPGFDLSTASYRSRYLVLLDALTPNGTKPTRVQVTKEEDRLYHLYALGPRAFMSVGGPFFIWVGRYLRPGVGVPPGDLEDASGKVLNYDTVLAALQHGYRPHYVGYVYDIDADTNVLTTMICAADGKQPASVCGRSVIKGLLKHVK